MTETRAIKAAYGDRAYKVAISSPKSMIGHLVGAAGIASALAAIGAIRDQVIPPTANLHTPDPECDLDYVPLVARKAKVETVSGQRVRLRRPERGGRLPEGRRLATRIDGRPVSSPGGACRPSYASIAATWPSGSGTAAADA